LKEDNGEVEVEEWRKLISYLATEVLDSVIALCKCRCTQQEKSGNGEECGGSFKETDEEPPVCMSGEALLSLEVVRTCLCSYKINIAIYTL
jgi:hypothetical protein